MVLIDIHAIVRLGIQERTVIQVSMWLCMEKITTENKHKTVKTSRSKEYAWVMFLKVTMFFRPFL